MQQETHVLPGKRKKTKQEITFTQIEHHTMEITDKKKKENSNNINKDRYIIAVE
jgi:hypothetical protein